MNAKETGENSQQIFKKLKISRLRLKIYFSTSSNLKMSNSFSLSHLSGQKRRRRGIILKPSYFLPIALEIMDSRA